MPSETWQEFTTLTGELADLRGIVGLLQWDQQTHQPPKGAASRARQYTLASQLLHQRMVAPRLRELVDTLLEADRPPDQQAGLRVLQRRLERTARIPADLVTAMAQCNSEAFQAWIAARQADDYTLFAPKMGEMFTLCREKAQAIDADAHPYDTLLDEFDPGASVATLKPMFKRLDAGLRELLGAIRGASHQPQALGGTWDTTIQEALHREVATVLGYDMDAGGLSFSEHPFTVGLADGDVRITTHLYDDNLLHGLGATIHEAGHGIYEQGMPRMHPGAGIDEAASVGMHESQSRFYENVVGRSPAFLGWLHGRLQHHFGTTVDATDLRESAMRVSPGLIRVSADEVTYNLHIIIRFELEVALLEGSLDPADLPDAWNEAYTRSLGLTPPSPKTGCLQDVHWSQSAIGYFPSYTLGNLTAASLRWGIESDVPDLWTHVATGNIEPVTTWLNAKIHSRGRTATAAQILQDAVGPRDSVNDLLDHLWDRYAPVYRIQRT